MPDPALKAGVNNPPIEGADRFSPTRDFMSMRSVGVMQAFTRDDKRKARSARFEREAGPCGSCGGNSLTVQKRSPTQDATAS